MFLVVLAIEKGCGFRTGTDTWSTATPWDPADNTTAFSSSASKKTCEGASCPCVARPCLFQIGGGVDPEERNDLAVR